MGFSRALVGLDLSPVSDQVVEGLARLQGLGIRELYLLYVIPLSIVDHPVAGIPVDKVVAELESEARERLERYRVRLVREGFKVTVLDPPVAEPAVALARNAETVGADVIVVGGKGRSWLREILVGSTVDELVRIARLPILVYRPVEGPVEERPILVGVDPARIDPGLLRCLEKLVKASVRDIFLAYVEEGGYGPWKATAALEEVASRLAGNGVRVHMVYTPSGSPARELLNIGEWLSTRLIVVGWSGRGSLLKRLLLGTTADAVVRNAPCPVMVCRG